MPFKRLTVALAAMAPLFGAVSVPLMTSTAVAQQVEVVLDRSGRRLLVDVYSGEVVAVEGPNGQFVDPSYHPPRLGTRQGQRQLRREWRGDELLPFPRYDYDEEEFYDDRRNRRQDRRISPDAFPEAPRDTVKKPRRKPAPVNKTVGTKKNTITAAIPPARDNPARPDADRRAIAAFQVLLDRAGASPGVIDGRWGQNAANAAQAYKEMTNRKIDPEDQQAVARELSATGGPAFKTYRITREDVSGSFVQRIPIDYAKKAELSSMAFTSVREKLAEKFHMDEDYLAALNPGAVFERVGQEITVANVESDGTAAVVRIVADKANEQVRAYDATGALVSAYPATIGSTDTPSPSGVVKVERVAFDPNYTYNPKVNFKQGENDKILTIPPGPNGPVGAIWIALSKPTYGIHGTPEPSKIGKTNSHGCVRLTNWDATELANNVEKGVTVEFID